jgi:hypothetical protein
MSLGRKIALAVGLGALAGAGVIVATGGEKILAVILVFVGASAMSGFVKSKSI